jgi:hypothetical protein
VILSDGRQTSGGSALDAARARRRAASRCTPSSIGDTRTERNARLELVEAPTNALEATRSR